MSTFSAAVLNVTVDLTKIDLDKLSDISGVDKDSCARVVSAIFPTDGLTATTVTGLATLASSCAETEEAAQHELESAASAMLTPGAIDSAAEQASLRRAIDDLLHSRGEIVEPGADLRAKAREWAARPARDGSRP